MNSCLLKLVLLLTAMFGAVKSQAAIDTIYYDAQHRQLYYYKNANYLLTFDKRPEGNYEVNGYSYPKGVKEWTGYIKDTLTMEKNGLFTYYYENGNVSSSGRYANGMKDGEWNYYRDNEPKAVWYTVNFQSDVYHGKLNSFYRSGKPKRVEVYENGQMISGKRYAEDGSELPFAPFYAAEEPKVDVLKYLGGHIVYPEDCRIRMIAGRVVVKFIVSEKGEIENVKVIQSVHPQMDREAIRVVKAMPSWKPATIDDEPVPAFFELPINFGY